MDDGKLHSQAIDAKKIAHEAVTEEGLAKEVERRNYLAGFFSVALGGAEAEATPEELADANVAFEKWWAQRNDLCDRCGQHNFMRQPMHLMGGRAKVCGNCFWFLMGNGPDPLKGQEEGLEKTKAPINYDYEGGGPRYYKRPDWNTVLIVIGLAIFFGLAIYIQSQLP